MKDKLVIIIVNSTVGKNGQIGYRTQFIINELIKGNKNYKVFCRDTVIKNKNIIKVLPFGELIPRFVKLMKLKLFPNFNHRIFDKRFFEYFLLRKISKYIDNEKNTVVHLWEYSEKIITFLKENNIKVIQEIPIAPSHETIDLKRNGIEIGLVPDVVDSDEEYMLRNVDCIISPSVYIQNVLTKFEVEKSMVKVIPFGVVSQTQIVRTKPEQQFNFIFVGALSKRKGLNILLEAWQDNFEGDRLLLYGRETHFSRNILKKYSYSNVKVMGFKNMQEIYGKGDVFILPSYMEGSAKSVYEAMSYGLPCVVTYNTGSIIEHNHDGIIIPYDDVTTLKESMTKLKNNEEFYNKIAVNAFEKSKIYTWPRYAKKVIAVYDNMFNLKE